MVAGEATVASLTSKSFTRLPLRSLSRMKNVQNLIVVVFSILTLAAQGQGGAVQPRGLLVVNDGTTAKQHSAAVEYLSFSSFGATFNARLAGGRQYSGLSGHIAAMINYDEPDKTKLIERMKEVSAFYAKAAPILKPRMENLSQAMVAAPAPPPVSTEPRIPKATVGGKTYTNVKPKSLRNGMMGFIHDSGAFTEPADLFSHENLARYGEMFPSMMENTEFRQLMETFVPLVVIGDKTYTGARLRGKTENELTLNTDQGMVTCAIKTVSRDTVTRLDAASTREETLKKEVETRKVELAAKVKQEQDRVIAQIKSRNEQEAKERMAKIEAEREAASASAAMWGAIGSAMVNSMFSPRAYVLY